ncbi:MAG: hypothetical protein ACYCYE_18430 [Clostridia bacterium]
MATKKQERLFGQIPLSAYTGGTGGKFEPKTVEWKGLNLRNSIDTGELSAASNISLDSIPYITPRASRSEYKTGIVNPQALFAIENALLWIGAVGGDDVLSYDDGTTVTTYILKAHTTDIMRCMVNFNGKVLIFPDKKYLDYVAVPKVFGDIGSGVYPAAGSCPDIDYAAVYNNRVFGVKGDDIYATRLGLYNDWTTTSTPLQPTDSWATDVASKGSFKGIAAYNNHVVMLKPEFMHQQYGAKPPFRLQEVYSIGTIDNRSVKEANNRLLFTDDKNTNMYTGGEPRPISINLNKTFTQARAGSDNRKYYLSMYDGSIWYLFVYDTWFNQWIQEDNLQVVEFAYWNKYIYALTSAGKILKFNSGTEAVTWSFETDINTYGEIKTKYVNEIRLRFELLAGSTLTVSIKYDNGDFETIKSYSGATGTSLRAEECSIHPKEADRITIKYSGVGHAKVYQMQLSVRGGD